MRTFRPLCNQYTGKTYPFIVLTCTNCHCSFIHVNPRSCSVSWTKQTWRIVWWSRESRKQPQKKWFVNKSCNSSLATSALLLLKFHDWIMPVTYGVSNSQAPQTPWCWRTSGSCSMTRLFFSSCRRRSRQDTPGFQPPTAFLMTCRCCWMKTLPSILSRTTATVAAINQGRIVLEIRLTCAVNDARNISTNAACQLCSTSPRCLATGATNSFALIVGKTPTKKPRKYSSITCLRFFRHRPSTRADARFSGSFLVNGITSSKWRCTILKKSPKHYATLK